MYRTNAELREKLKGAKISQREIAEALGYSKSGFNILLHTEFTDEMKRIVGTAIHEISLLQQGKAYRDPEVLRKAAEDFRKEVQKCQGQSCKMQ